MSTPPPPPPPGGGPPPPPPPPSGDQPWRYEEVVTPGGKPLATPWMRVLARFLDGMILFVINFVIAAIVVSDATTIDTTGTSDTGELFVAALISLAVSFVWDPVLTATRGGTPLKLAFGMRVVRSSDGGPVSWGQAVIRWGLVAVWSLIPVLALIVPLVLVIVSLVFIFTKPLRQAVWDRVAKTLVVSVR